MSNRPLTDDESLSSLLDGGLSPEDAVRLEQRLAREPALRARLDALERGHSVVLEAYDGSDEELRKLGSDRAMPRDDASEPQQLPESRTIMPLTLIAGIAVAFGVALGILIAPDRHTSDALGLAAAAGAVALGTPLFDVLESVPSAESREVSAVVSATPVLTFSSAGGYCREVDLVSVAGGAQLLACRQDGGWRVTQASYGVNTSTDGVFRPASGPSPAIDAAIEELIDGAPLDAAVERELIERGWSNAAR